MAEISYVTYRDLLLEEKNLLLKQKNECVATEKLADATDQAVEDQEKELNSRFNTRRFNLLKKIDKALKQIEDENYGICESCGGDIEEKRLLARPTATCCVECKIEQERKEKIEKSKKFGGGILWDV